MSAQETNPSSIGTSTRGHVIHPDDILDSCLEFMGSFVTKSLRVKYDKWQKLVTAEDSKVRRFGVK